MAAVEPQGGADAAERVQAFANAWRDRPGGPRPDRVAYVTNDPRAEPEAWLLESDLRTLLADRARTAAELEQAKRDITIPVLCQAWRNGWADRGRAAHGTVGACSTERDAYEAAFARYMSDDPAEADKDPYRPDPGPDDPAAAPARPADGGTEAQGRNGATEGSQSPAEASAAHGASPATSAADEAPRRASEGGEALGGP